MKEDIQALRDAIKDLTEIVTTHIAETKIYRTNHSDKLIEHHHDLNGNGKVGLKTKVDRLERSELIKNWIMGVVFTGLVAAVFGFIFK